MAWQSRSYEPADSNPIYPTIHHSIPTEEGSRGPHQTMQASGPQKRKRAKYTRSKKGCLTCRTKKIKCDEVHPVCIRCVQGRLECAWPEESRSTPRNTQPHRSPSSLSDHSTLSPASSTRNSPVLSPDELQPISAAASPVALNLEQPYPPFHQYGASVSSYPHNPPIIAAPADDPIMYPHAQWQPTYQEQSSIYSAPVYGNTFPTPWPSSPYGASHYSRHGTYSRNLPDHSLGSYVYNPNDPSGLTSPSKEVS